MKTFLQYSLAATLVAGSAASHQHHHQHLHAKKSAPAKVEKREPDVVTEVVVGATETVYQLGDQILDPGHAQEGLADGAYIVVGETSPTYAPPPPPEPTTSASAEMGAKFIESEPTPETEPAPQPTYTPPPAKKPSPAPAPKPDYSSGTGVDSSFPSGKIKCSEFPSSYGAVALDWLDFGGWSGLQFVPDFTAGALSISNIITGIGGDTCTEGCMCSYACPAGYQKTQWPQAQGSTKESIGGLYCNSEGYLELTRPDAKTLCEPGVGGVSIQNDLDEEVCTCRTDYPGTENMVIPAVAQPGGSVEVCNPEQDAYYVWDGMATSAQYYINPKGYGLKDACVWNSSLGPNSAGNWAPLVLGVGKAKDGITYISIFQNLPTSTAKLDFNVEIKGDVNSKCSYVNGKWTGGSSGCTTGMAPGGKAIIRYF